MTITTAQLKLWLTNMKGYAHAHTENPLLYPPGSPDSVKIKQYWEGQEDAYAHVLEKLEAP